MIDIILAIIVALALVGVFIFIHRQRSETPPPGTGTGTDYIPDRPDIGAGIDVIGLAQDQINNLNPPGGQP